MVSEADSSDADERSENHRKGQTAEDSASQQSGVKSPDLPTEANHPKTTNFKCDDCGETFRKKDYFDRHRFTHTGVREFRCTFDGCDREYTNRAHLSRHMRTNHTDRPTEQASVYYCKHGETCGKSFATLFSMERHYRCKHVAGKTFVCRECGESFWRKVQLRAHSFSHTGAYPQQCAECGKGFLNLASLRHHNATAHRLLHRCEQCGVEFVRWTDLVAHRKLAHVRFFECADCGAKFRSKRNLKQHIWMHQRNRQPDDEREVFACPYEGCSKFYDYSRNLTMHIRSKHEGMRRFVCPVEACGRALTSQQKLDQHRRLHELAERSVMKAPPLAAVRVAGNVANSKKQRKDAGIPKRSTACRLANVRLERAAERLLIEQSPERRPSVELDVSDLPVGAAKATKQSPIGAVGMDSASESESETGRKVSRIVDEQLARIREQLAICFEDEPLPT